MIKKLIEKFFTLTAFISAVCLAVHYAPTSMIFVGNRLDFIAERPIELLFSLVMLASAVLLLLDLFSLKIKIVQNQVWKIFAAIGVIPILPIAPFGLILFVFDIIYYIKHFFEFLVGLF